MVSLERKWKQLLSQNKKANKVGEDVQGISKALEIFEIFYFLDQMDTQGFIAFY